jgi:hypothetical protein
VPGQQRVRCHNRGEISEDTTSEILSSRRQSSALRVAEPQTPVAELFAQDAVLFLEIFDDVALLLVHPSGERHEQELQWLRRQRQHGVKATRGWSSATCGHGPSVLGC